MKLSTPFWSLVLVLTSLITPAFSDEVNILAEKLVDWNGWDACKAVGISKQDVRDAWDEAIDIAYVSSGKIHFDFKAAKDFLGDDTKNTAYQDSIQKVLNNAHTFKRSYWWNPSNWGAWKTAIRCDDPDNLCTKYRNAIPAYTMNPGKRGEGQTVTDKDTINICPNQFKARPTCKQAFEDFGNKLNEQTNLNNFQCRGYVMLHEMFHLKSLSDVGGQQRVLDLSVYYQSDGTNKPAYKKAYGVQKTKVLAKWPYDLLGLYIVRNADNLAQYSLASWVASKQGVYPNWPFADGTPADQNNRPKYVATGASSADTSNVDEDSIEVYSIVVDDSNMNDTTLFERAVPDETPDTYIDCANNGGIEWATAPSIPISFAIESIQTFCNNVGSQNTNSFNLPNSDTELFLGAISQTGDTTCTSPTLTASDCISQLGNIFTTCDTTSSTRKYGGISATNCLAYVAIINGTRGAVAEPDVPWSCSLFVQPDSLGCACTDGEVYPLVDEVCSYPTPPSTSPFANLTLPGSIPSTGGIQIALASYIPPLGDPDAWTRLIGYPQNKVSMLVANVVNGPDSTVNKDWEKIIKQVSGQGKRVLGYVRTGYLGVSYQGYKTRLGSTDLADWASQIETDVDLWYQLYPGYIGGIFFDEGWNDCGPNNLYSELYRYISENTKRKYPGAYTVINPGTNMPQCFENSADTLMTFESSYEQYTTNYSANTWTATDTRKIWHIIYGVSQSNVAQVAALAQSRGAGFVHITNEGQPNPYNVLPDAAYMQDYINAVSGGSVLPASPLPFPGGSSASTPSGLAVIRFDYTSVSLSWSPSSNAIGYRVYLSGNFTLNLPSSMTTVTIGNLAPGTPETFEVTAVGGDGSESGTSNSVSKTTDTFPGSGSVLNVKVTTSAASTNFQADILAPYAYVRIYIHQGISYEQQVCNFDTYPGWPINYNGQYYICTHYMVENDILYQYTGIPTDTSKIPWTWTSIGAVKVQQDEYHWTWTIPLGTSTVDTSNFVIQTEGYGPLLNVFQPCPGEGGGVAGILNGKGPSGDGRYCA